MTKDWVDRLPRTLRVAAYDFQIERWKPEQAANAQRYGECSTVEQRISIQTHFANLPKMVDTVMHEVSHAIYWAYGIDDADKEERIVGSMGTGWTQVWRDNPKLLDWLCAVMTEVRQQ